MHSIQNFSKMDFWQGAQSIQGSYAALCVHTLLQKKEVCTYLLNLMSPWNASCKWKINCSCTMPNNIYPYEVCDSVTKEMEEIVVKNLVTFLIIYPW